MTDTPFVRPPFWMPGARVQVQSVLFNNALEAIERAAANVARATELAITAGLCANVTLRYGDSSVRPCLDSAALAALQQRYAGLMAIEYDQFGSNLGSAQGHNRLAAEAAADFILVQNPDVVVSPRLLETMLGSFQDAGVGIVEAKQVPIEHPKDYDPVSGETSWATTACALTPVPLFRELGGFDADSFFLYCDDVDYSWLVRLAGYKVVFQPAAVCFHDKRLSADGAWQPSSAERYFSAEAALVLAHKWSRPDKVAEFLDHFDQHGDDHMRRAAKAFRKRKAEGHLPIPRDSNHNVGTFEGGFFAKHRFPL